VCQQNSGMSFQSVSGSRMVLNFLSGFRKHFSNNEHAFLRRDEDVSKTQQNPESSDAESIQRTRNLRNLIS
jgi:hypothetical protein